MALAATFFATVGAAQDNFSTRPRPVLSKEEIQSRVHDEMGRIIRDRVNEGLERLGKPVRLFTAAAPVYPPELRRDRVTGEVEVLFLVNEAGVVEETRIEKSTHDAFGHAVVAALKQWKFGPLDERISPARFTARQIFVFQPD